MKKENHNVQTFDGVYEEMKQYFCITHTKKKIFSYIRAKNK